jgi:hypothetical protein
LLETDDEDDCLEMMPSWCRQVNWGNCGIPWVNCPVVCVKDDWKGQFWGLCYRLSKLCSLLSFPPWGVTSHSKIAQFNREFMAPLGRYLSYKLTASGSRMVFMKEDMQNVGKRL